MLVITRKAGEEVYIENEYGDKITLRVLNFYDDFVRIGIQAPDDFVITRDNAKTKKGNKTHD